jgi:hypothetical protein
VEPGEDTYDGTVIEAQYRPALLAGAVAASASPVFAQHSVSLEARIADYVAIFAHSFVPIGERRKKGRES